MSAWLAAGGPWLPGMAGRFGATLFRVLWTREHPRGLEVGLWQSDRPEATQCRVWGGVTWVKYSDRHDDWIDTAGPDLDETDGPTLGAMAQHVRELTGDPRAHVWWSKPAGAWAKSVHGEEGPGLFDYATEAVSWAAALVAPKPQTKGAS